MIEGGDLDHSFFSRILSIGYEFETKDISKLTELIEEDGKQIFLNTEVGSKDVDKIVDEDEEVDYYLQLEQVIFPVYTSMTGKKKYTKSKFYVTNDVNKNELGEVLKSYCGDKFISDELYKLAILSKEDNEPDAPKGEYNIQFVKSNEDVECNSFTSVEWLATYFKPKQSTDIILRTFANAVLNIIRHLDELNVTYSQLIYYGDGEDEIVDRPRTRKLFYLPKNNLYYLQLCKTKDFSIEQIFVTPQMTFSAHVDDMYKVMKSMMYSWKNENERLKNILHTGYEILKKIEMCAIELMESYKIKNKKVLTYIELILYKIHQYYSYLRIPKEKRRYFKNSLFYNSRHSNYSLYQELKKHMKEHYRGESNTKIIERIRDLIVQPEILSRYIEKAERKGVFLRTPRFEKPANPVYDKETGREITRYGNPEYSLVSYLEHFENPLSVDENIRDRIPKDNHDWLVYNGIDVYSQTMEIKKDILLVEVRTFGYLILSYLQSIGLKNKEGNSISIEILRKFLEKTHFAESSVQSTNKTNKTIKTKCVQNNRTKRCVKSIESDETSSHCQLSHETNRCRRQ